MAFTAKIEIAKWPVFAWIGRSTSLIYVDREHRMSIGSFVESVRERMQNGVAVLVFPEGTNNAEDELLPFKTGGFAAVAEMPDGLGLPVYIWAKMLSGRPTTIQSRSEVAWSSSKGMWQSAWKDLGVDATETEVLLGELISTEGKDRKELARLSQDQVEALKRSTMNSTDLIDS